MKTTRWVKGIDWLSIALGLCIFLFGIINIYSVDSSKGIKQLVFFGVVLVTAVALMILNTVVKNFFQSNSWIFYLFSILGLAGLFVFGKEINGAKAWYSFGSFSIQPVEFAKIATALLLATFVKVQPNALKEFSSIAKMFVILGIPIFLILNQPDLGSVLVFFAFIIAMYREGLHWSFVLIPVIGVVIFLVNLVEPPLLVLLVINLFFLIASLLTFLLLNIRVHPKLIGLFKGFFLALSFSFGLIVLSYLFLNHVIPPRLEEKLFPKDFLFAVNINHGIGMIWAILGLCLSLLAFLSIQTKPKENSKNPYQQEPKKDKNVLASFASAAVVFLSIYLISLSSNVVFEFLANHHKERIMVLFEGEEKYRETSGYNLLYSKTAIGSGALLGKGFKQGTVKRGNFVPEQSTDYIFCTVGEEWGFAGSLVLILLYTFLILRLYWLAEQQKQVFNRFFGYAVASIVFIHFGVNIGMVTGLFPTVGIPLPLFSYGGSSLLGFGLLLSVFLILVYENKQKLY